MDKESEHIVEQAKGRPSSRVSERRPSAKREEDKSENGGDIHHLEDKPTDQLSEKGNAKETLNRPLKETDHLDQIQKQADDNQGSRDEKSEGSSKRNEDEEKARRTVTVVEHGNGFKSKALKNRIASSSSESNRESENKDKSDSGRSSVQEISEKSKPLSPNSSLKGSSKDIGVYDYKPKKNSSDLLNSHNSNPKNSVKFKEEEVEYGEDDGSVLPAGEVNMVAGSESQSNNEGNKQSSTKITSILKNSNPPNSDHLKEMSVRMSKNIGDTEKDNTAEKTSNSGGSEQKKSKKSKRKVIPNMKVEEDQVNLSDLGNGPEKPTIKTIVKKMIRKQKDEDSEPTPARNSKKVLKSPGSSKSGSSLKKSPVSKSLKVLNTPKSSKYGKSPESSKKSQNMNVIGVGDNSMSDSEYMSVDSSDDYKPMSDLIDYPELVKEPSFRLKKYKDALYRGTMNSDTHTREGLGIMQYDTGRIYEGQWENDLREGTGYELYANGNLYQGQFSQGKAHGEGCYKWANGEYYNGNWNQGQKHGYGEWKSHDGDSYKGEWKEGKADGQGMY